MHDLSLKQAQVLRSLASGATVTAAAEAAGLHRTTVHHWCRTVPHFRQIHQEAKAVRAEAVSDELHTLTAPALDILRKALEDDAVPLALKVRIALAIVRQAAQPAPATPVKAVAMADLADAAYYAGLCDAREESDIDERQEVPDTADPSPEIQHNSSQFITNSTPRRNTPRNAPCPCRSGLKYKRCCGKAAPLQAVSGAPRCA